MAVRSLQQGDLMLEGSDLPSFHDSYGGLPPHNWC